MVTYFDTLSDMHVGIAYAKQLKLIPNRQSQRIKVTEENNATP
jgi:hypothetical protein